ncbi:hypothetical protein PR003_g13488 [Phytophthora rubi]|uniref:Tf2-1-like SH3-like domain-containing protein n=1 Tax=Phytophthora rubi TaxID=129364 RepID=A0A6A4F8R5_9STRA|nr:hypothetical protein PR002_g15002 [Phytophthora rubi]KAE9334515.1 hypothetical protein PR003_g13488 [Phytophthora rubi]
MPTPVTHASTTTRKASSDIAAWTNRTLINPSQRRRGIEFQDDSGAGEVAPPQANFPPITEPQPRDAAAVNLFLQQREQVTRYVRDAIATAVDRQKEYADQRGRKNLERFLVGDRVLLSTAGIQLALITDLGAKTLAPRYLGQFKILKVMGDAYTLPMPTALRLHPTFYVGRLRRYHPAAILGDAAAPTAQRPDLGHSAVPGSQPQLATNLRQFPPQALYPLQFAPMPLSVLGLLPAATLPGSVVTALCLWCIARTTNVTSWRRFGGTTIVVVLFCSVRVRVTVLAPTPV